AIAEGLLGGKHALDDDLAVFDNRLFSTLPGVETLTVEEDDRVGRRAAVGARCDDRRFRPDDAALVGALSEQRALEDAVDQQAGKAEGKRSPQAAPFSRAHHRNSCKVEVVSGQSSYSALGAIATLPRMWVGPACRAGLVRLARQAGPTQS